MMMAGVAAASTRAGTGRVIARTGPHAESIVNARFNHGEKVLDNVAEHVRIQVGHDREQNAP